MGEAGSFKERYCRRCRYPVEAVIGAAGVGVDGLPRRCVCPECGRGFNPADPRSTLDRPWTDWWAELGQMTWGLTLCAALLAVVAVVASFVSSMQLLILWFGMLVAAPLAGLTVLVLIPRVRARMRTRVIALVSVAVFASIALTQWPFRASFALHRAALDRHTAAVRAGTAPVDAGSMWIGAMHFVDVRHLPDGTVGLRLNGGDSGGDVLVQPSPGAVQVWYNASLTRALGGGWYLVWED